MQNRRIYCRSGESSVWVRLRLPLLLLLALSLALMVSQVSARDGSSTANDNLIPAAYLPLVVGGYPPQPPAYPWAGEVANTFPNCGLTRVFGLTLDRNGGVAGDIFLHLWADGWDGAWGRSSWILTEGAPGLGDEHNWDVVISNRPLQGTWYVCVVPEEGSWDCVSNQVDAKTVAEPCEPTSDGVQVVRIIFQHA